MKLNDGTEMPVLGLGTWKAKPGEVAEAIVTALRAGYRHIDAAHIYLNQREVGEGLRRAFDAGVRRDEVWVTSKLWMVDFEPQRVGPAVDVLLKDLGLEYLDQVLLHWPVPWARPPEGCPPDCPTEFAGTDQVLRPRDTDGNMVQGDTPMPETWRALEATVDLGKVRSIGVSNFAPRDIEPLLASARIRPAVDQVECHPGWNQASLKAWLDDHGIQLVAYSPLGNPALYKGDILHSVTVKEVAQAVGRTPAQVILRWSLQRGNVVIPKSAAPARIAENTRLFDFQLTQEQMAALDGFEQRRLANPKIRAGGRHAFDEL